MSAGTITRPPTPRDPIGDGGDGGGGGCPWGPGHLPVVVYTFGIHNWFAGRPWKCYLIRCWACDLEKGPYETWGMANYELELL